jgi:hypothetical protein
MKSGFISAAPCHHKPGCLGRILNVLFRLGSGRRVRELDHLPHLPRLNRLDIHGFDLREVDTHAVNRAEVTRNIKTAQFDGSIRLETGSLKMA